MHHFQICHYNSCTIALTTINTVKHSITNKTICDAHTKLYKSRDSFERFGSIAITNLHINYISPTTKSLRYDRKKQTKFSESVIQHTYSRVLNRSRERLINFSDFSNPTDLVKTPSPFIEYRSVTS